MTPAPPPAGPGAALAGLAVCCDQGVDRLLSALPVAADRVTQDSLDGCLDALLDLLRMVAAVAEETAQRCPADPFPAGPAARAGADHGAGEASALPGPRPA